jgi:hypothetical protein
MSRSRDEHAAGADADPRETAARLRGENRRLRDAMKPTPLFVAPSAEWTGLQTLEAFARERGRELGPRRDDGCYSFVDGEKRYRTSIVSAGRGWVFAVFDAEEVEQ